MDITTLNFFSFKKHLYILFFSKLSKKVHKLLTWGVKKSRFRVYPDFILVQDILYRNVQKER